MAENQSSESSIQDDKIKCNETTLVMEDPYDDDDYYKTEERSL